MTRASLRVEVIREVLRATRAARTKAMELPDCAQREAVLRSLGETVDALQDALCAARESLRTS